MLSPPTANNVRGYQSRGSMNRLAFCVRMSAMFQIMLPPHPLSEQLRSSFTTHFPLPQPVTPAWVWALAREEG